jgi:hypothetical protein
MTRVGVGTQVTDEDTAYLTDTDGDGTTLSPGETTELTLEARDRFNNPPDNASETTVTAEAANGILGETGSSASATPDEDGEVTFEYTAPSSTGTQDIEFTYGGLTDGTFDESTPQDVVMAVDVQSTGGGGGGSSAYSVSWEAPNNGDNSNEVLTDCSSTACTWDVGAGGDGVLTLRAATSPSIEGANIDFAVDDTTLGTISPEEATTGSVGDTTTELTANANGDINVYAASGGSSDVITISMENTGGGGGGGGGAAGAVTYDSGATTTNSGEGFSFAVDTGGNSFTLQNASIDTSTMPDGVRSQLKTINIDGTDQTLSNSNYPSDGTRQELDTPSLNDGSTIEFREFNQGGNNNALFTGSYSSQSTEPTSGDYLTVTLGFSDGTEATLYFIPP